MKYLIVGLTGLLLAGCATSGPDLSNDLARPQNSAPAIMVVKPFSDNPNVYALSTQLEQNYTGTQVQVLRVGNEVKVTYPADALFGVGGVNLTPNTQNALDPFVVAAKAYPDAKIRIDSFTDNSGLQASNVTRSEDRAQNVARYLLDHGFVAGNITLKGYGGAYYVASNDTPEGRAQNRRIVLTISNIPLPQPVA
ncbi:MAG: OmpA family protein [Pseudomonadota bacterium]